MSEALKQFEKLKFVILYFIAIIAICYGAFAGNFISFVFGVLMLAWIVLLRLKAWRTDEVDEEDEMEVNEENESKKDE